MDYCVLDSAVPMKDVQWRVTKMIKGQEHLFCEERLGELVQLSSEKRFRGILSMHMNTWKESAMKMESLSSGTQIQDKRQWEQTRTQEVLSKHQEELIYCTGDGALA